MKPAPGRFETGQTRQENGGGTLHDRRARAGDSPAHLRQTTGAIEDGICALESGGGQAVD